MKPDAVTAATAWLVKAQLPLDPAVLRVTLPPGQPPLELKPALANSLTVTVAGEGDGAHPAGGHDQREGAAPATGGKGEAAAAAVGLLGRGDVGHGLVGEGAARVDQDDRGDTRPAAVLQRPEWWWRRRQRAA